MVAFSTATDLLAGPIVHDIIIADFGRDAAIEYLRLAADEEKRRITRVLKKEGLDFFDEYRRIMFTAVSDVTFFKAPPLAEHLLGGHCLTDDILIGEGFTPISADFVDRVALASAQVALAALQRGHRRIRLAAPCNGLSPLMHSVANVLASEDELSRLEEKFSILGDQLRQVALATIETCLVPDAVVARLVQSRDIRGGPSKVLVLGTIGANAIYRSALREVGLQVVNLDEEDYRKIDRAIVASIGGDAADVDRSRDELSSMLISAHEITNGPMTVLEACTDFNLGLGTSTLQVFAEAMVDSWYSQFEGIEPCLP